MNETRTRKEAEAAIRAAGYRVADARTWFNVETGRGYVCSVEGDRSCYGHPLMEVRYSVEDLDARPYVTECAAPVCNTGRPLRVQVRPGVRS